MENVKKMGNNRLLVAASSLLLTGIITINGITLVNGIKRNNSNVVVETDDTESLVQVDEEVNKITCLIEKIELENGSVGYKLPEGFQPYYVNSEYDRVGIIGVDSYDGYSIYTAPSGYNLDGYIGVKTQYISILNYKHNIDNDIENKKYDMVKELEKKDNGYYLSNDYVLYTNDNEARSLGDVTVENGLYQISDELVSKYVGIPEVTYDKLIEAEALENIIRGDYYDGFEKTDSRNR